MEVTYLCPFCRGAINAENNIILSAKSATGKVGLILLHEEIGNYSVVMSPTLTVKKDEVVDMFCPVCNKSLNTLKGEYLAKYIRLENGIKESNVIISRKCGEKITFVIDDKKMVESYGESLSRFIDPEWFL